MLSVDEFDGGVEGLDYVETGGDARNFGLSCLSNKSALECVDAGGRSGGSVSDDYFTLS